MRYYKIINGDYIVAIGKGLGGVEISANDYYYIFSIIQSAPYEEDKTYLLRTDLTWEEIGNNGS